MASLRTDVRGSDRAPGRTLRGDSAEAKFEKIFKLLDKLDNFIKESVPVRRSGGISWKKRRYCCRMYVVKEPEAPGGPTLQLAGTWFFRAYPINAEARCTLHALFKGPRTAKNSKAEWFTECEALKN